MGSRFKSLAVYQIYERYNIRAMNDSEKKRVDFIVTGLSNRDTIAALINMIDRLQNPRPSEKSIVLEELEKQYTKYVVE